MTPQWFRLLDAKGILTEVRHRLESSDAVVELGQFDRLSADETDLLIARERGQ